MAKLIKQNWLWFSVWAVVAAFGCLWLARGELQHLRSAFETDARIVHRLLSQRLAQHDAILAMLSLLQPVKDASGAERRLPAIYPQILNVRRRSVSEQWDDAALQATEAASRRARRPMPGRVDFEAARYVLVAAAEPASYAIEIDMREMVPWSEWPMARDASPVRVALRYEGNDFELQPGSGDGDGWRFDFRKQLAVESQPFDVVASRRVSWRDLPWLPMLGWALAVTLAVAGLRYMLQSRAERRRAEELLRLGQVGRLNALGELAAGMAHELNQPLTALMASTQAAGRLLQEAAPDLETARDALRQAAEQARRAADVVGRLRHLVERPDSARRLQPIDLGDAVGNALYLVEPECRRLGVTPVIEPGAGGMSVMAEPVALEQIVHNLLMNALQALERVPLGERGLRVTIGVSDSKGVLVVSDCGPGISAGALPHIFEPFFTSREGGLGLGLSLCESLAAGMGGALRAGNRTPRGAVFTLELPLAEKK